MQIGLPFDAPPPAPPPPAAPEYSLQFVRHRRARRYIIRVADDRTVRVTIPNWGSKREARAFAERERAWIDRQLRARSEHVAAAQVEPWTAVEREALRERARTELPPRLLALAATFSLTVTKISVRNQKWRWGSCSPNGHICLNWRLVTMPDSVRDYVLIHELMHLKRMDHSRAFWRLVEQACPWYREARAYLRRAVSSRA